MVRKMVEDYKGEISVNSEVGKGSTFTILLPSNLRARAESLASAVN